MIESLKTKRRHSVRFEFRKYEKKRCCVFMAGASLHVETQREFLLFVYSTNMGNVSSKLARVGLMEGSLRNVVDEESPTEFIAPSEEFACGYSRTSKASPPNPLPSRSQCQGNAVYEDR